MISDTFSENLKRSLSTVAWHRVLFIFFLFSIPFSIRKVLGILSADGIFNEYMDVSVYLSDILLLATLSVYILENKSSILSIEHWKRMFHVEHLLLPIVIPFFFVFWSGLSIFWSESILLALAAFIKLIEGYGLYLYILTSNVPRGTSETKFQECSTWNNTLPQTMMTEMFHVEHPNDGIQNVPRGTFKDMLFYYIRECSTWNILQMIFSIVIISAFFQSLVAILQFIQQKSLGLTFLKESIFSVYDPGVAKVLINGDVLVRSYGFSPHPNALGGFLSISLLITMAYPLIFKIKMFHVEHLEKKQGNVPRGTFYSFISSIVTKCSTWNIWKKNKEMFHVEHSVHMWIYRLVVLAQLGALSFSFSKSAMLAYIIGLIMLVFGIRKMFHVEHWSGDTQNVPRGTFKNRLFKYISECSTWNILNISIVNLFKKMFHVEHLVIIVGVVLLGIVLFSFNLKLFLIQPFVERLFYMESLQTLSQAYFFQGLGIGQFVFVMQQFFDEKLLPWQFQPIHNVFLLIFSEVGIIGLGLFLWFFIYAFLKNNKNVPRGTIETKLGKCSTWNNSQLNDTQMFHVEQFSRIERKGVVAYLFRSILVAIAIIMLFDHYFWDIQQGQLLLWIILGLAIYKKQY